MKIFRQSQLETLRQEYAKHQTAPVSILPKFHALFAKMPDTAILQLKDAQIKFVSKLALNEAIRRNILEVQS